VADKPKRPRKPKQQFLDGMEPPSIRAIDDAAENYYDTMLERKALTETENEQKDALIDLMKENQMARYVLPDGKVVEVTAISNVKVKSPKKANEDLNDDD
jgi:hypothetical protein